MTTPTDMSLRSQLEAEAAKSSPELAAVTDAQVAALIASNIRAHSLKEGERVPDFTLPDAVGHPVALADALAKGPVVIAFYRGEWCPYCNLQLHAYQAILPQITAMGASLLTISPQTPDHSLSMAEKHALTFAVLSDVGNAVARQFGLVFPYDTAAREFFTRHGLDLARFNGDESWELPVPATYVVAPDGVIALAFVDPDFRHRLEPSALLDSLRALAAQKR